MKTVFSPPFSPPLLFQSTPTVPHFISRSPLPTVRHILFFFLFPLSFPPPFCLANPPLLRFRLTFPFLVLSYHPFSFLRRLNSSFGGSRFFFFSSARLPSGGVAPLSFPVDRACANYGSGALSRGRAHFFFLDPLSLLRWLISPREPSSRGPSFSFSPLPSVRATSPTFSLQPRERRLFLSPLASYTFYVPIAFSSALSLSPRHSEICRSRLVVFLFTDS